MLAQEWFRKALSVFLTEESRSENPGYWQYRIGKMRAMGYRKAVDEGNIFAAHALGCLYRRGQGVEKDETRAIAYFSAAAKENEYAQRLLNSLHPQNQQQNWLVTDSALSLLRQTARIFEDKLQEYYAPQVGRTDRKLLSKIAEKKLAQGQKLG